MTTDDLLKTLHDNHGDYLADISVEDIDGHININIALSKLPGDEPIGIVSWNAPTLEKALVQAVRYLEETNVA